MLVTFNEASRHFQVSESWLRRQMLHFPGFPDPVTSQNGEPLYDLSAVQQWWTTPQESEEANASDILGTSN